MKTEHKRPKFTIGDMVTTTMGQTFIVVEMVGSVSGGIFYREGPHMPYTHENCLSLVHSLTGEPESKEEEIANEAAYEPKKYLSRLDKELHVDEAVSYFGQGRILDEIGVDDCIDHFGEAKILDEIGEIASFRHFKRRPEK